MRFMRNYLFLIVLAVGAAYGQAPAPDHSSTAASARTYQKQVDGFVLRAAEKVSDADYAFKATPDVRSLGQLFGHIADANNNYCAVSMGETNPNPGIEKGKTTKAELVAALKASMEYCAKAFDALTAENANQMMKFRTSERSRLSFLMWTTMHMNEHYGNIVTYMRLKGITPPSSER
jgi:uncharacterized damage-inducible protein DinB